MIKDFACKRTKILWEEESGHGFPPGIERVAFRKLVAIHHAKSVGDLRVPPGNRLEKLSGRRAGQYSIRINEQWRICFCWEGSHASEVEIVDYH